MAVASPSSSATTMMVTETKPEQPSENAPLLSSSLPQPDPKDPSHLPSFDPLPPSSAYSSSATAIISSSSYSFPIASLSPPAAMAAGVVPPAAPAPPVPSFPSFRPVPPTPVGAPQFSPILNPAIHSPGVSHSIALVVPPVSVSSVRYPVAPQPYAHMSNGYPGAPMPLPVPLPSSMPPGMLRYPPPYTAVIRPAFPSHPPGAVGAIPPLSRPPFPAMRGVPPIVGSVARPVIPIIPIAEKPQTTVYVGKIATTVENDFLLSLLRLCGPVKSWKRAQDPTTGAPKGFGFCEFESAEGVLRALRLLSKLNIDGQELVLNVNQATRDYLERYVEKKVERQKTLNEEASENADKEETAPGVDKTEPAKTVSTDESKEKDESVEKPDEDAAKKFGIVTEEDQEGDRDASIKLTSMLEERAKNRPPPPPPPAQAATETSAKTEVPSKSRDGDSDADFMKIDAAEDRNVDETNSEHKLSTENEKPETSSSDRGRRQDRSKESDHEHDLRREKERELERYERERERERMRREREREHKLREAERLYKDCVKEWEAREREREYQRSHEREREKERERERRREIKEQEDESDDDDSRKRRHRGSTYDERRRKRQREKDEDLADRLREEEEIADANRRAIEEQQKRDELKVLSNELSNGSEKDVNTMEDNGAEHRDRDWNREGDSADANFGGDEGGPNVVSETRPNSNAPSRKLGFGLVGSGKRTAVPSVFQAEDDEDAEKEKKMRPLVPIEYSMEEMQAVQPAAPGTSANLVAAAEFAKRITGNSSKEEKSELEKERSRRTNDRLSQREKDWTDETKEKNRDKGHDKDKDREHGFDRKTPETKKLLDAKQLIDMIPKTKEELFAYDINWAIYDKHDLHERMRPWISKKITEFLGEEETTLVDYIVTSTKDHVKASQMMELLQAILDDEAEMFVLKMWRMLIFEIKKVETGLSLKSRT